METKGASNYAKLCPSAKTKLTNLDIGNNAIGPDSGAALCDYLKDDDALTHLNLYMNELSDDGAVKMSPALKDNATLKNLDIGGTTSVLSVLWLSPNP